MVTIKMNRPKTEPMAVPPNAMSEKDVDDFLVWATLAVVLGGRIGYVSFYKPGYYFSNPLEIFQVWQGGMSFHGGLIGVIIAVILFSRLRKLPMFAVGDAVACAAPIGLFLGRLANFINGELFGRATDVPWGIVFPHGGPLPRHPSQVYEALLEGLILFIILFWLSRKQSVRERHGMLVGVFLIGYTISRGLVEFVRQPDAHLGTLVFGATMGQLLSIPFLLAGLYLVFRNQRVT